MGNFSKFPTCAPFSMLLSDYSQINLGDSTIKFSRCILASLYAFVGVNGHAVLRFDWLRLVLILGVARGLVNIHRDSEKQRRTMNGDTFSL